jgi:hypothetical protein
MWYSYIGGYKTVVSEPLVDKQSASEVLRKQYRKVRFDIFTTEKMRIVVSWVMLSNLKTEATRSSEMLVKSYKTTRRHNPEDHNP